MYPYIIHKMGSPSRLENKIEKSREDVLTSLFLGGMKYLPSQMLLFPFLEHLGLEHLCKDGDFEIRCWPTWDVKANKKIEDRDRIEPDWIIESENYLIVGESKFGSPLDDTQLNREWVEAKQRFKEKEDIYLVTLTNKITDQQIVKNNEHWKWVGWDQLASLLQKTVKCSDLALSQLRLLNDLIGALDAFDIVPLHIFNVPDTKVPELKSVLPFVEITVGMKCSFSELIEHRPVKKLQNNFANIGSR